METTSHTSVIIKSLLFSLLCVNGLQAASYTYNTTIDLTTGYVGSDGGLPTWTTAINGAPTFDLQPGDELTGTISFAPGQAFQCAGPLSFGQADLYLFLSGPKTDSSTTTTLLGVSGVLSSGNPFSIGAEDFGGATAAFSDLATDSSFVSFTGLSYSMLVQSGGGDLSFSELDIEGPSDTFSIVTVPEPCTSGLFAGGLVLCATLCYRLPGQRTCKPDKRGGQRV